MSYCVYKKSSLVRTWVTLVVAQLVDALRYKPEGREFDSQWCHWNFSFTHFFRPHYGPEVDSASDKYFLGG
jgi:hypothetical protein